MASFAGGTNGSLGHEAPLAQIDEGSLELWSGVDRLIDRASGLDALTAHRLHLLAADRWMRIGRPVPDTLIAERRGAALLPLVAGILLQKIRDACDGPIVLLKGPDVAAYYPDPALRPFRDLDLLVPDAAAVHDALLAAGFEVTGDERLYTGIHHLRPLFSPKLPLLIEVHERPKWIGDLPCPDVEELFAAAVPSATGVEGISTLPSAHHALVVAVHAWAHLPLRRALDIVDVAAVAQHAGENDLRTLARAWGLERLWRTTETASRALLYRRRMPMSLRIWARDLRSVRERTVLESHLGRTFSSFWALPPRRALAVMSRELRQHFRREPGETWRAKLARSIRALQNPLSSVVDHDRAVEARGLQAPSKKEVRANEFAHTVTNLRVLHAEGDGVRVTALVNAIHHPAGVRDRHCTMHNRYDMTFVRSDGAWRMSRLVIENRLWSGDPQVMLGA